MSERSRFADRDRAEKSDQLYEATEYSRRCLCDDIAELTFDNIKLNATIKKSKEDFANLQNRLMCSLLLMLGNDDDVDRIIEKADELTRAFKDERVSTLQCENAKLRELIGKIEQYVNVIGLFCIYFFIFVLIVKKEPCFISGLFIIGLLNVISNLSLNTLISLTSMSIKIKGSCSSASL